MTSCRGILQRKRLVRTTLLEATFSEVGSNTVVLLFCEMAMAWYKKCYDAMSFLLKWDIRCQDGDYV